MLKESFELYSSSACLVLSGTDGSGKTTMANILTRITLNKRGSACIHWFRGSHLLAFILLRFLSSFRLLKGPCNPYYKVCIPSMLKPLWIHLEFWSLLPHVFVRFLLKRFCRFLVCDRGLLDFMVWIIVTLNHPAFLRSVYGKFLLRLALREKSVYLYADLDTLVKRADVPREFIARELAVYNVLARYVSPCSIDTGSKGPLWVLGDVLRCLATRSP